MNISPSVLVVGSANTDLSVKVRRLPKPGETILGGEFASACGGKGANQAVGAARAGADVTFLARIGRDPFGDQAAASLAAGGINLDYLIRDPAHPSGVALVFVDDAGENSIAVAPGSNNRLAPSDLENAREAFGHDGVLLLQLEIPMKTVEAAAELAHATGRRVILNPAPAQALAPGLLRHIFVLTPNESETESLTGMKLIDGPAVARAAAELLARGPQNIVITLGARGAYVAGRNGNHWIPGYKVNAVDSTAAGDVFNGALAAALAEGQPLAQAVLFANAAAAISVTRLGAQSSAPARAEIEQMLAAGTVAPMAATLSNGHPLPLPRKRAARIPV